MCMAVRGIAARSRRTPLGLTAVRRRTSVRSDGMSDNVPTADCDTVSSVQRASLPMRITAGSLKRHRFRLLVCESTTQEEERAHWVSVYTPPRMAGSFFAGCELAF